MSDILDSFNTLLRYDDAVTTAIEHLNVSAQLRDVVERKGTLNTRSATLLKNTSRVICQQLGLSKQDWMPSLESFASVNAQSLATTIALEGLTETTVQASRHLVVTQEGFLDGLSGLFKQSEETEQKLSKDAALLQDVIRSQIANKTPKRSEFEHKSLGRHYQDKNAHRVLDAAFVDTVSKNHEDWCSAVGYFPDLFTKITDAYDHYVKVSTPVAGQPINVQAIADADMQFRQYTARLVDQVETSLHAVENKVFINGKVYHWRQIEHGKQTAFMVELDVTQPYKDREPSIQCKTPSPKELYKIADDAKYLAGCVKALNKHNQELEKKAEKLTALLEKVATEYEERAKKNPDRHATQATFYRGALSIVLKVSKGLAVTYAQAGHEALAAGRAALLYCEACVKQY